MWWGQTERILKEKIDFILNVYITLIFKNIKNYYLEETTSLYTVSWNPCETKKSKKAATVSS